ncbi:MAG: ribosome biogenesis GTPase YlqF [Bacteriovoracaceae bacterium]|nr:ribosome biogenesis GTPase YlqF [Bacteriovoracaceae bacterium]
MGKSYKSKKKKGGAKDSAIADGEYKDPTLNWYPGHMIKALNKIKENIKLVDVIIEIRDARSPLATGNQSFSQQFRDKKRLIVMNKTNLADPKVVALWEKWFSKKDEPFVFINGLDSNSLGKVIQLTKEIVKESRSESTKSSKLKLMIVGLPNTGKSTIINRLSNRDASKVADKPGQTTRQLWVKVNSELEILDTPGIMPPFMESKEQVHWLSALHAIPERITDSEDTACYIIRHILENHPKNLRDFYKIDDSADDLVGTLNLIAKIRGCIRKKNEYDYERVYKIVIADFRKGNLGLINFGLPPTEEEENQDEL